LRATIEWSYDLLGDEARRLLAACSVFRGGVPLEVIEPVWAEAGTGVAVLDGLQELVDQSLLRPVRASGTPRYLMLETIREFAAERLAGTPEAARLRGAHAAAFLALAGEAGRPLTGLGQKDWLERLDVEHNNIRAAIDWYRQEDPPAALRLAAVMWLFWSLHGHFTEGRQRLRQLLGLVPDQTTVRVRALNGAAWLAIDQGDYPDADRLLSQSTELSGRLNDKVGEGMAAAFLCRSMLSSDRVAEAAQYSRLFTVLRRGRHVMVVTGADPDSVLASPALQPYRDLFEVITRGSGDARAFRGGRAGSVFLVRPDGYLAARGRPDRLEMVLGYFRELSGETEVSRPGRPTATSPALPTVPLVSDSFAIPNWAASTREGDLLIPEGADVDLDGERLVDPERLALAGHRVLHVGGSHQAQHGDGKVRVGIDQPVPLDTRPGVVRHLGDVIFRGAVGGDDLDHDEHAVGQVLVSGLDVGRQSRDVDNGDVRNATVPGSVGGRNPGREHPRLDACPGDGRTQRGLGVIDDDLVAEALPRRHEHPPVTHLVSAFVRGKPDRVVEVVHGVRSETPVMRDAHASSSGSLP